MEELEGTVDQVVYYNPENGYCVCRFLLEDEEVITIVGYFPPLSAGEVLRINGTWELNSKYGRQFRVNSFVPVLPSSVRGIQRFLSSGLVKGIGPVLAKRIVDHFGSQTMQVLTTCPEKLLAVEGIGPNKLQEIIRSWEENKRIRDLIIFLQEYGISTSLATKIYRHYGDQTFKVLRTNPYQLCLDVWGIGFRTADQMALRLGCDPSSLERIAAFIHYYLERESEQGHLFSYRPEVVEAASKELAVSAEGVEEALEQLISQRRVLIEVTSSGQAIYLPYLYRAEETVARGIIQLASTPLLVPGLNLDETIKKVESQLGVSFSHEQRKAIEESWRQKILIITGGPGTGKTTLIRAIVEIYEQWGKRVLLAAPTGRAAKRLAEATGREAKTIHRLLEYNPKEEGFRRNEKYPLAGEVLIIDEFSMVDILLMEALIKAIPLGMRLILVGDSDQLPSVGPGNLLRDLIESQRIKVVRLTEIFRQVRGSLIVLNAHRVQQGLGLIYSRSSEADFLFIAQEEEEKAFELVMDMACDKVPSKLRLPPLNSQIQVITPMYRGLCGVENLNRQLQARLNPQNKGIKLGQNELRVGDKVMQIRNNYDKEVFNGDLGTIVSIDPEKWQIIVDYDGRSVLYERDELGEITLAYAISVHKSQGNEYQGVIMPLLIQHYIMLQRNLFYTALTRAKKFCVIIGSFRALHIAIKNDSPIRRNGLLKDKLQARLASPIQEGI
ncbi:MAG: ATP-dependent RecD-like DNA helicase [Candidatus Aminicenantes bacterium]|nr:ATP-dependent RecD-like DNA helicase [Candidatus Aminicenantes bacterium]